MPRITEKIRVDIDHCEVLRPFYVRWRSTKGGINYWMFSIRQDYGLKTGLSGEYRPFSDDLSTARASKRYLQGEANETVTVYADQVSTQQIEGIKTMLLPVRVEWLFDVDGGRWVEVTPQAGSFAICRTDVDLHEIVITFDLQPINIPSN